MSVSGEPCKNDFVILGVVMIPSWFCEDVYWKGRVGLGEFVIYFDSEVCFWSTQNLCSIYLLSLGVNNMSKLLLDHLNFLKKKKYEN